MGGLPELPEGPVTIMFTDIEGSTALRTTLGDAETDVLFRQHDDLIREQIEAHRGKDQKAALGDGFLAVFVSTRRAVACAIAIQRALDTFNRTRAGAPLHIRIGLNTGEVAWQDGQLSGEAVHASSRVCGECVGGQILISDVTRQLAGTIPDVTFRDAGEHQLKGFPQPWRLWDVVWVRETSAMPDQVFVGRENELATLRSKLLSALDGRGGTVLVGGEPGVGKTTLVRQLIVEAEQRGALAVFGRCYESEGAVPYSPFVEMLEQALAIMPPDIVREDMGDDAPEVARLVPELRRRFPDIGEPLDLPPEQQRRYFFNALGSFISRGAARFPLLLVLDDVHWADEPTLLLIEHLASIVPDIRVLAVGTYRDVELEVSRPLAASLERMLRARLLERVSVKRFDRGTVATMLQALAERPAPDAIVDAVFDETEGNPFFVEEVFRHLVEEGKVFDENGEFRTDIHVDDVDVPESVRLVVGRRLERLGPESQKVLAAGAVVGRGFPFSLLEVVSDVDAGTLLDIVEEAEAARVIVPEERDGEIHYTFAHELIRQTLLSGLSLLRRQRLHLAVANAIESTDRTARQTRPSEIANHLMHAGAAAEPGRTLEYLQLTAERALEAAAYEEALRAINDALTVIDEDDVAGRVRLSERRGQVFRALGRFEEALQEWDTVVDGYAEIGEPEAAASVVREMAYVLLWLGRFDKVLEVNLRGLAILGDRMVAARSYIFSGNGALLGLGGVYEEAEEHLRQGQAIAEEVDDLRALGWSSWMRSLVNYSNLRLSRAIEYGHLASDQLRSAGDLWTLCDSLSWTSLALGVTGIVDEAAAIAEEADELSTKLGHVGGQILSRRALSLVTAQRTGDLERLETQVLEDRTLCESIGSPWVSQSHTFLGACALLRGQVDESREHLEKAIASEPASAFNGVGEGYMLINRAFADDRSAFLERFDAARRRMPHGPASTPWGTAMVLYGAGQGAALLGIEDVCAEVYAGLVDVIDVVPLLFFDCALGERVAGMVATVLGRFDEAESHFEAAKRWIGSSPNVIDQPQVELWHGRMLLARNLPGDAVLAREEVASARATFERLGMPLHAAMAERSLSSV